MPAGRRLPSRAARWTALRPSTIGALTTPPTPTGLGGVAKAPVVLGRSAVHLAARLGKRRPAGIDQRRCDTVGRVYRRVARTLGVQK